MKTLLKKVAILLCAIALFTGQQAFYLDAEAQTQVQEEVGPGVTRPVETSPVESSQVETLPVETSEAETSRAETSPIETLPAETLPETSATETSTAAAAETSTAATTAAESSSQINPQDIPTLHVNYRAYQDQTGWGEATSDNQELKGASGNYLDAIRMTVTGQPETLSGTIAYQVAVSGSGWQPWAENNGIAGAEAAGQVLEAVAIKLTGTLADYYDIYYSVWQNGAWTEWAVNGAAAGSEGTGVRIEGMRAIAVLKGEAAPSLLPAGIDPERPMVALTFDDGPSSAVTGRILDSLQANGGRATFFMVGNRVSGTQAVVQRMVSLNCEVANHTYDHKYLTKLGDGGIRSQVGSTNQKIADVCGVTPKLVRPPGGYYNKASLNTLGSMGLSAIMWNIDTLDWKTKNAQNTINVVLNQVKDGDIVLMHDIYKTSADAAVVIIPELVKRGYQLVTVSEMAQYRGGAKAGAVYNRFRP